MAKEKVTVSVKTREDGSVDLQCSHPLPNHRTLALRFKNKQIQRKIIEFTYFTLPETIQKLSSLITNEEWANAIAQTIQIRLKNLEGVSLEAKGVPDSYLVMGENLFQLSPVKLIAPTKAIAEARKLTLESAKIQAAQIVADAETNAASLLRSAEEKRQEAKKFLEESKSKLNRLPEEWALEKSVACQFMNGEWHYRFPFEFWIEGFDVLYFSKKLKKEVNFSWPSENGQPERVYAWIPIAKGGNYSVTRMRMDNTSPQIPHISHNAGCMGLADAPKKITNYAEFCMLKSSVKRAMTRVQLNSLRVSVPEWLDRFKHFVPTDLYEALKSHSYWDDCIPLAEAAIGEGTHQTVEQEESETWRIG